MFENPSVQSQLNLSKRGSIIIGYFLLFFALLPLYLIYQGIIVDKIFHFKSYNGNLDVISIIVIGCGSLIMLYAMITLRTQGKGLPISHLPPTEFVGKGLYGFVRHPIYLGYNIAFFGIGLKLNSVGVTVFSSFFLLTLWIIYSTKFEEEILIKRFGSDYLQYRIKTPLLPLKLEGIWILLCRLINPLVVWISQKLMFRTVFLRVRNTVWVTWGVIIAIGSFFVVIMGINLVISDEFSILMVYCYLLGIPIIMIIFGRLFWLFYQGSKFFTDFWYINRKVGFVSYGSYFGVFISSFIFGLIFDLDPLWVLDRTLMICIFISGIGRIGCISYGCCFGREVAGGIVYTDLESKVIRLLGKVGSHPRYPTQMYAALYAFVIFLVSIHLCGYELPSGAISVVIVFLYSISRFILEFYRDQPKYTVLNLTSGQIGAMILWIVGFIISLMIDPNHLTQKSSVNLNDIIFLRSLDPVLYPILILTPIITFVSTSLHIKSVGEW